MSKRVAATLRLSVEQRADRRCEYCRLHSEDAFFSHEPDHIIASKHRGQTREENLAWACYLCNRSKGSDLASIDPESDEIVRLFNPRKDVWADHFRLEEGRIIPLTAEGRVTEFLLQFNLPENIELRNLLSQAGRYPR